MNKAKITVLKFGWEFPPFITGGLGQATHDLTASLRDLGVDIVFVLPRRLQVKMAGVRFVFAGEDEDFETIAEEESFIPGYSTAQSYRNSWQKLPASDKKHYAPSLFAQTQRYGDLARPIAKKEKFDVIHAHDWLSYQAGMAAKEVSGKPLILHVHATQYNQSGGQGGDPRVVAVEKAAFKMADKIIAISWLIHDILVDHYGVPTEKIEVVHNGRTPVRRLTGDLVEKVRQIKGEDKKIVLYLGRITIQKGPDYFLRAARKVIDYYPQAIFIMVGNGDMYEQMMHLSAELGITQNVILPGGVWGDEKRALYEAADLFVMPSVSEPFGLVPLEAIDHDTPAIVSYQSGVAEVLNHALKVDFWDVDEMANKMVAVLRSNTLGAVLLKNSQREIIGITWDKAAKKCLAIYQQLTN